ncbi:hypothetical protein [Kiloniella antarctica]|uniref:Uncharacterized protein n=1 Tax=Kiloniella antarctica TaxID=1550907 RepID=A0ABW5BLI2_9PROT
MNELSTRQGLSYFALETNIEITDFEAQSYKQNDWISAKDLPCISTIQELFSYFKSEPKLGLIDFEIAIENIGTMSTHDDGEPNFIFKSKEECISTLEKAISKIGTKNLKSEILDNPGFFIDYRTDESIMKYDSFDGYLKANSYL